MSLAAAVCVLRGHPSERVARCTDAASPFEGLEYHRLRCAGAPRHPLGGDEAGLASYPQGIDPSAPGAGPGIAPPARDRWRASARCWGQELLFDSNSVTLWSFGEDRVPPL